jgi:hypothetical protein
MKKSELKNLIREEIKNTLNKDIFYVVMDDATRKYFVKRGSQHLSKSNTGSLRFKTESEAKAAVDQLNKKKIK